ncbi:hypothetical protein ACH5RR_008519 [Cinchona calisaya]|uniref:Uncharacterized protein n=1 Tax=Cinchona calisaya TaxID=153742 RepID=A0ABD3ABV6_9GENT
MSSSLQSHPIPEYLIGQLNSSTVPYEIKVKAPRDLKNQIIGNRTKKLSFLKLGAVPCIVSISSSATTITASRGAATGQLQPLMSPYRESKRHPTLGFLIPEGFNLDQNE